MGVAPSITLPSGQRNAPLEPPGNWVERSGTTRGSVLRAKNLEQEVSSAVAWHRQRPIFQGYRSTTLAVASDTWTPVPLDVELVDTHAGHSDTSNTGRWYAPETNPATSDSNYYLVTGYVPWGTASATQAFVSGLSKSGATPREGAMVPRPSGHDVICMVCDLILLDGDANDYVELQARHNIGASANISASSHVASMTARWVCAGAGTVVAMPSAPRTWTAADEVTADTSGGASVPLNTEIRDRVRFMHYPPIARLTSETSTQTVAAGSFVSIQMPTQSIDNYTGWSSGANSRYTCQRPGLYIVYGQAGLLSTNAASGYVAARILHTIAAGGTAEYYGSVSIVPTSTTAGTTVAAHGLVRMAAGDYVELQARHNLAAAKTVKTSAGGACRLLAVWIGR